MGTFSGVIFYFFSFGRMFTVVITLPRFSAVLFSVKTFVPFFFKKISPILLNYHSTSFSTISLLTMALVGFFLHCMCLKFIAPYSVCVWDLRVGMGMGRDLRLAYCGCTSSVSLGSHL